MHYDSPFSPRRISVVYGILLLVRRLSCRTRFSSSVSRGLLLPRVYGGKTSTIKLTTLSERGPPLGTKDEEKRVTAASWPSVGSGVDRRVNACTGQDAFLACVGLLRGRRNGLTVFVDDPSLTSTLRNRDAEYVFRMLGSRGKETRKVFGRNGIK